MASAHEDQPLPTGSAPSRSSGDPSQEGVSSSTIPLLPVESGYSASGGHDSGSEGSSGAGWVLRALRRRWLMAATVGLVLGSVAAAAGWFLRPAKFTAFALIKIDSEAAELLPRNRAGSDLELYRMTQAALIKSPKVLEAALSQDNIRQLAIVQQEADPVGWLENTLIVEPIRNTELLRVGLSASRADETAELINAIVKAYLKEVVNRDQRTREAQLKNLKSVVENTEKNLDLKRKNISTVAKDLKATDPTTAKLRLQIALEEYIQLLKARIEIAAALRQAGKLVRPGAATPEAVAGAAIPEEDIEQALADDPEVQAMNKKVELAEQNLTETKTTAHDSSSFVEEAKRELKMAREALDNLKARLRKSKEWRVRRQAEAEARMAGSRQGLRPEQLQEHYQVLEQQVNEKRLAADRIGADAVEWAEEQSKIEQEQKILNDLRAEKAKLEAESRSTVQRVKLEVEATPPRTKNYKAQLTVTGLGGSAFFLMGVLGVALWDHSRQRIYTREDVVGGLRLRVLGSLPVRVEQVADRSQQKRKLVFLESQWSEALSGLRTILLHEASQHGLRVILVGSAGPEEGKTTLVSNLAVSLASAGRRTLLIDADLRRPLLHSVFAARPAPGLCEILRDESSFAAAVQLTAIPGLELLSAGTFSDSILPLLARGRLEALLQPLRPQYDAILLDSSSIMAVNDALLISQQADAVLLSIRPGISRTPMVQETCERLRALDIPVLGTVLNGLNAGQRDLLSRYVA